MLDNLYFVKKFGFLCVLDNSEVLTSGFVHVGIFREFDELAEILKGTVVLFKGFVKEV